MKTTATLEEAIHTVREASKYHREESIPVPDMSFDSLAKMRISGEPVSVDVSAQRQISSRLGVPYSYLSKCPEGLQAENLNHWIRQERKKRKAFLCRFNDTRLRAVFTERYSPIDNQSILKQLLRQGFDPGQQVQYILDDTLFLLKIPEYARAFNVGGYCRAHGWAKDEIVPGVSLANSETGLVPFSVEAFFYRRVCQNGMVVKTSEKMPGSRNMGNKALENFRRTLACVIEDSKKRQFQFMLSTKARVEDPFKSIEAFGRRFGLTQSDIETVRTAYWLEQGETLFHVINAFTRAAQDPGLDAFDKHRLEEAGGRILSLVKA